MMENWTKIRLTDTGGQGEAVPPVGEPVALYCVPRERGRSRQCDVGRVYVSEDRRGRHGQQGRRRLYWQSAAGLGSGLDGKPLTALCRGYVVWFSSVAAFSGAACPWASEPGEAQADRRRRECCGLW